MRDDTDHETKPLRILGIGGSMRQGSLSRIALAAALRRAEDAGAKTVLADVRGLDLPLYVAEHVRDEDPPSLGWLLAEVRAADAYILCSPTYHGTLSGAVKNALDVLDLLGDDDPPYFGGKVVGLMALGGGAANVLNALQHAARALGGLTSPTVVAVPNRAVDPAIDEVGDEAVRRRLDRMVHEMIDLTRRLRLPPAGRNEPES